MRYAADAGGIPVPDTILDQPNGMIGFDGDPTILQSRIDRHHVVLRELADIGEGMGPNAKNRENARHRIVIRCNTQDRDLANAVAEIEQRVQSQIPLPAVARHPCYSARKSKRMPYVAGLRRNIGSHQLCRPTRPRSPPLNFPGYPAVPVIARPAQVRNALATFDRQGRWQSNPTNEPDLFFAMNSVSSRRAVRVR